MRFDPENWQEVPVNAPLSCDQSRLFVRSSKPVCMYVTSGNGVQALAGVGCEVDVSCTGAVEFYLEGEADARCFFHSPSVPVYVASGEVWSNSDRRPLESEHVQEVTRALRLFRLEQKRLRDEMMAERSQLRARRRSAALVEASSSEEGAADAASEEAPGDAEVESESGAAGS